MSPRLRLGVFAAGAIGLAGVFAVGAFHCVGPAAVRDRYSDATVLASVPQRHTTDAVTFINFDARGFDTLGEEFILFVSVAGTLVLLRQTDEKLKAEDFPDAIDPARDVGPTDAIRVWTLGMVAPKVILGFYLVLHGQLSPGGGFQGGVVLATAPLIIYLAEGMPVFKKVAPKKFVEIAEACGAGMYVLTGGLAVALAQPFLTNVLPFGKTGEPSSGGTIAVISAATGLEVAAGFVLLLYAFLQKTLDTEGE